MAFEALLAGTPVVVADDSGCGEMVAETGGGVIVPVGDDAALSAAIRSDTGVAARVAAARAGSSGAACAPDLAAA